MPARISLQAQTRHPPLHPFLVKPTPSDPRIIPTFLSGGLVDKPPLEDRNVESRCVHQLPQITSSHLSYSRRPSFPTNNAKALAPPPDKYDCPRRSDLRAKNVVTTMMRRCPQQILAKNSLLSYLRTPVFFGNAATATGSRPPKRHRRLHPGSNERLLARLRRAVASSI